MIDFSETALEKIADIYGLTEPERSDFIGYIRMAQTQLIYTTFFTYYARTKNALEQEYFGMLWDKLANAPSKEEEGKFLAKVGTIMSAEFDHSPELYLEIQDNMVEYVGSVVNIASEDADPQEVKALVEEFFPQLEILKLALKNKYISEEESGLRILSDQEQQELLAKLKSHPLLEDLSIESK